MFLDDELEAIYRENGFSTETSKKLLQACVNRFPNPDGVKPGDFLNELRKIEAG